MHRIRLALPLAAVASLVLAMPALAGGWASVIPDEGSISGVEPGVPHDVSVTLLQHGVTPVRDGTVRFILTDAATGAAVVATAHHVGAGVWKASVTVPAAGRWALEATHADLELQATTPIILAVGPAPVAAAGLQIGTGPLAALLIGMVVMALGAVGLVRLARPRAGQRARSA
jgi:hypothetical protein